MAPNYEATTKVPLSLLSGSHASYEASTYAADFDTALSRKEAAEAAATASGQGSTDVSGFLTAAHAGDTTYSTASFAAPSEAAAVAGLKAGVSSALQEMTTRKRERAEMELTAATTARRQLLVDHGSEPAPPDGVEQAPWQWTRDADLAKATERAGEAQGALADAQMAERSVGRVVEGLAFSTTQSSTRSDQLRMVLTAGLSALLLTIGIAALAKWFAVRRTGRPAAPPDGRTPAHRPGDGA